MSAPNNELVEAVELALADKWDAAHAIVQQYDGDARAAWVHAALHKIEGDLTNCRYWYRLAGKLDHLGDEPRAELTAIKTELLSQA